MPFTPIYGLPYPSLTEPPDGPDQFGDMALAIETELARIDTEVNALQNIPAPQSQAASGSVSTTSTTYVALSGDPGVAFTAPVGGRALVHFGASMDGNAADTFALVGFQIRTGAVVGSGTVQIAANDNDAVGSEGASGTTGGRTSMITGLTPGSTYNVQLLYKRLAGTGTAFFARRTVIVQPIT